jgi:16S rRNA processing protein RimM
VGIKPGAGSFVSSKSKNQINWKVIGKVKDAQGIKGDLFISLFVPLEDWVEDLETVQLGGQTFKLKNFREHKQGLVITVDSIQDRNAAEALKGKEFAVDPSLFISAEGDAIYLSEILDFEVIDAKAGLLGRIHSFVYNGVYDLLVLEYKGVDIQLPFVDEFIIEIDHENKQIKMQLPEGLLDVQTDPNKDFKKDADKDSGRDPVKKDSTKKEGL